MVTPAEMSDSQNLEESSSMDSRSPEEEILAVSELRQKNEELKKSEERYHKMVEEVEDYAILLLDPNGVVQNWNKGAKKIKGYLLQGDWRYLNFPQDTYGFGGHTTEADAYSVTYKYIQFYESVYRKVSGNFYAGLGYQMDHHWGIEQLNIPAGRPTDFNKYRYSKTSTSSGIALNLLYDTRKNSINPEGAGL